MPEIFNVLVARDGEEFRFRDRDQDLPGGRPEGDENWRATLEREVLEEACARVDEATLLGFSTGAVVRGPEEGLVLVRALWRAGVSLGEWEPRYETSHRLLVPPSKALAYMKSSPRPQPDPSKVVP